MNLNLIAGIIVLAITAAFGIQRDFSPMGGLFPDPVLIILGVLSVVLIVRGIRSPERANPFEGVVLSSLLVAVVLLGAWALSLGVAGFVLSGLVFFLATALFLRERPVRPIQVLADAGVSVLFVVGIYVAFTQVLLVPLPTIPF
jgi:uncharacterized membrane protein YidH (DUF202 family)